MSSSGRRRVRRLRFGTAIAVAAAATSTFALDIVTIDVRGIPDQQAAEALEEQLRSASLTAEIVDDDAIEEPVAQDLLGLAQSDYARLLSVLYQQGYFGPLISIELDGREAAEIDPFTPPQSVQRIDITVQTGPRFRFGQTDVAPLPAGTPTPLVEGFQRGAPANSDLVAEAANAGVREWREEGHAKADVAGQSIQAVHPAQVLNVDVTLAPGPRLRFGDLTITGDTEVSFNRIRQIMGYPKGEVYSPEEIRDAVNRLRRSGVFRVVTLEADEEPNPNDTLDYTLTLIDEQKRRFGISAEYATIDGVTIGGFWLHRNLFGGAERFRVDGEIANLGGQDIGLNDTGGTDYSLGFRATRPGTFGADNDAFFFGDIELIDDPDYTSDSYTLGLGVSRYFSDTLYGEVAGALRYSDVDDAFGEREFFHVTFPSTLEWDRRDDPGDAASGFYLSAGVLPFIGLDDTSQTGAAGELDARTYYGLGSEDRVILAGRLLLGSVVGSDLDATPPDFLFFSGGADTVRGQPYQSLGVEVENGGTSGGRSFLGLSGEIRTRVTGSLGLVAFYDVGYVGPDSWIGANAGTQSGTGLGVRYATPIGPIRVDLATPVAGERDAFSALELYIGVGQSF